MGHCPKPRGLSPYRGFREEYFARGGVKLSIGAAQRFTALFRRRGGSKTPCKRLSQSVIYTFCGKD